jgi:uncharacterized ParB-like nuclease family protein
MTTQDIKTIELKKIRLDGGTQPRKKIYEEAVQSYTEVLLDGVKMPPVTVFFDGKEYWLADGFHRYHAHKRAGFTEISCILFNGTKREAFIFSLGANHDHGIPRTNEEKRDAVITALHDVELCDLSDVQLARICNVSNMTVGRVRKSLELARSSKVVTKQGKTMDTHNIGPKAKPQAEPETPEYTHDDRLNELATEHQHTLEENIKLRDRLAIGALPDAEEAKAEIEETIDTLRAQVASLEIQLNAVTQSRNDYQQKNNDLIKQVTYWKRRAEKAEKVTA